MKKLENEDKVHIHDYHKEDVRERRKMAHITFTDTSLEEYDAKYKKLFSEEE